MFKKLLDFGFKRTCKEALGFYVSYFALIILSSALASGILGLIMGRQNDFGFGVRVGAIIAIIVSVGISFLILKKKILLRSFGYLLLLLVSGVAAYFGGGLLGLVVPAYLTTR